MSARKEILANISKAVKGSASLDERRRLVSERIAKPVSGAIPGIGKSKMELVSHFSEKAKQAEASLVKVKASKIGEAVADFLRENNLPQAVRCGVDERLKPVQKQLGKLVEISTGRSHGDELVSISHAFGGVAETGTLILSSGPENPTTLNFLPENHIVLIREADIHSSYEAVLDQIRKTHGAGNMPRTVNMVTGPSRSADIEQTLILGAHGPVRLHIVVVED